MSAYRKKTLRSLPDTAKELAGMANELHSILVRTKHLVKRINALEERDRGKAKICHDLQMEILRLRTICGDKADQIFTEDKTNEQL